MADLIDYKQASKLLGMNPQTLYTRVNRNQIPYIRYGKRNVKFSKKALKDWMEDHTFTPRRVNQQAQQANGGAPQVAQAPPAPEPTPKRKPERVERVAQALADLFDALTGR